MIEAMRAATEARLLLGLAILAFGHGAQGQDLSKVEIATTELGGGLYMLTGAGGNIGVSIGPDGVFLVDDQFAPLTPKIEAAVAALTPEPVRFVINTHWHGDHTGGNENLAGAGALIVAHESVRTRMSTEQFMAAFDRRVPPSPESALPVVTFDSSIGFHLNGSEIKAVHLDPSHTDGDAIVHFRDANVIHTGDTFLNGMYPFTDLSSGGDFEGFIAAAEALLARSDASTKIIPGHGPLATRADLVAFRDMLVTVRDAVRRQIQAGVSRGDVIAARPTAALDARFGGGSMKPDRFVGIVYDSLSAAAETSR